MQNRSINEKVGSLCCDDYKGINNQYVDQGKVVLVENMGRISVRGIPRNAECRTTAAFRRKCGGGTESIVTDIRYAVRRLTPTECERLQGLPDGWTFLPGEKSCSDSARYKALGNGMAQPCADYILKRLVEEVERSKE